MLNLTEHLSVLSYTNQMSRQVNTESKKLEICVDPMLNLTPLPLFLQFKRP